MTPPTTTRRRRHLTVGAVALALVVSACSSTDDSTGADVTAVPEAPTATEPTDAPAETPDPSVAEPTEETATQQSTAATGTETTEPDVVVPEALRFTAPLVGGGEFDGAAYAGKPTVFWFWAPT